MGGFCERATMLLHNFVGNFLGYHHFWGLCSCPIFLIFFACNCYRDCTDWISLLKDAKANIVIVSRLLLILSYLPYLHEFYTDPRKWMSVYRHTHLNAYISIQMYLCHSYLDSSCQYENVLSVKKISLNENPPNTWRYCEKLWHCMA